MKRNLLWRGILILAVLVCSVALVWPPGKKINLGLDLRGGMHLVLQVQTQDALRTETEGDMTRLAEIAKEEGAPGLVPKRTGDRRFEIAGASPAAREVLRTQAGKSFPGYSFQEQADKMVFEMRPDYAAEIERQSVNQAVQTINNRIDEFGVTEPVIQPAADNRIVIQLPGVADPERVKRIIKNTAFLEFRIVRFPQGGGGGVATREEILANFNGQLPDDVEVMDSDVRDDKGVVIGKTYYAVDKRRDVTGRDLKTARSGQGQFGDPIVLFSLTPDGATKFAKLTGDNVGKGLAIVLDGRVASAPVINSQIRDSGQIEGRFTREEVDDLSTVLRSGALPAGLVTLEERTVGPSLGRDSIDSSLKAGLLGAALIVAFVLLIYNLSGVNAVLALGLNVIIVFAGLAFFKATLTLPGIAGIILTIGMAVDANVLVFERIREEVRAGRTVRSAIDLGFEKALSSIVDSNVTTLIAALFLFQFGTGPIKGFAVTLTIGILASMFTAIFVSRWLFDVVLSRRRVQKLSI